MTETAAPKGLTRRRRVRIGLEILVNAALPFIIYYFAEQELGDVHALLASMLPPLGWSLLGLYRSRRIDVLSITVLGGIALSLVAFVGTGSARMLQLRENLVTGLIGLAFLASALIRRPLIYMLAQAIMQREPDDHLPSDELRENEEQLRKRFTVLTLVWGCGLVIQAGLASALVFKVSIATYLLISPFIGYGTVGMLAVWTLWFNRESK